MGCVIFCTSMSWICRRDEAGSDTNMRQVKFFPPEFVVQSIAEQVGVQEMRPMSVSGQEFKEMPPFQYATKLTEEQEILALAKSVFELTKVTCNVRTTLWVACQTTLSAHANANGSK